jgi:hypothetical protein
MHISRTIYSVYARGVGRNAWDMSASSRIAGFKLVCTFEPIRSENGDMRTGDVAIEGVGAAEDQSDKIR